MNTAKAIAAQPFKSFDVKFPSGIRFSFEKRGLEFKVLEGQPGKSRQYRFTGEIDTTPAGIAYLRITQLENEPANQEQYQKALAMFWQIAGQSEFWI